MIHNATYTRIETMRENARVLLLETDVLSDDGASHVLFDVQQNLTRLLNRLDADNEEGEEPILVPLTK